MRCSEATLSTSKSAVLRVNVLFTLPLRPWNMQWQLQI